MKKEKYLEDCSGIKPSEPSLSKEKKNTAKKTVLVILIIVFAVAAVGFITGYIFVRNTVLVFAGLMSIGIINILNGLLFSKVNKGSAMIFIVGGGILTIVMLIAVITRV